MIRNPKRIHYVVVFTMSTLYVLALHAVGAAL